MQAIQSMEKSLFDLSAYYAQNKSALTFNKYLDGLGKILPTLIKTLIGFILYETMKTKGVLRKPCSLLLVPIDK